MKYLILVFILQITQFAFSQEKELAGFDPKTDIISDKYEAGAFLIYDCEEKHWVCVLKDFYDACSENRKMDLVTGISPLHTCAPIGEFPTKKSCFQRQLFLTGHNHGAQFCVKEKWKNKAIDF